MNSPKDFDPIYHSLIQKAILIRCFEERIIDLFKQGKLNGTLHTCIGQELTGVVFSQFVNDDDFIVSNHRGHGHYIAHTGDITGLICEIMGRINGCSGGIGGSQHLYSGNFLSNGIQGGMTPTAAGISLANKMKNTNSISLAYIGDGTLGEGILYETFNLSSIWDLPVVFVLENNKIAQSTSFYQSFKGSVQKRAEGFDLKYFNVTVTEIEPFYYRVQEAIEYARKNSRPVLIEVETNRLFSHSKGDDNRSEQHIRDLEKKDLLNVFKSREPELFEKYYHAAILMVDEAVEYAEKSEILTEYHSKTYIRQTDPVIFTRIEERGDRINEEIYQSLKRLMENRDDIVLLGEDIETSNKFCSNPYGGAFKVTKDLSLFFSERVKNTPISEASIVGIGLGLAIAGYRPIVEIMFGDFLTLTLDQVLQHASKFQAMYGGKINVPIIIRTPMGGHRGYGPTHSQSLEKHFLGIPGVNVVALNHRLSPDYIYKTIIDKYRNPFIAIENKVVYTNRLNVTNISGYTIEKSNEDFPTVRISIQNQKPDLTIVGYGGVLIEIENALTVLFDQYEIIAEVICPTLIYPFNIENVFQSVRKTEKLLLIEEGHSFAGFGSEIISQLLEKGLQPQKIKRLSNNSVIPCSLPAEQLLLPGKEKIIETALTFFNK